MFTNKYSVVAHHANDSTGFSGTLLRWTNEQGGIEYTLSLRSTEFKPFDMGGDRERDNLLGANGEIIGRGFALGQLAALEDFYQREVLPIAGSSKIYVTGYSLGGHLATVFTETHADAIKATYLFNGAGRGEILGEGGTTAERMAAMIAQFRAALLSEPSADVLSGLPPATRAAFLPLYESALRAYVADPGWNPFAPSDVSVYADPRYRWAQVVTSTLGSFPTRPAAQWQAGLGTPGDALITSIYGSALKEDLTLVANSQIHASNEHAVYIEGQPLVEGLPAEQRFDFGNTHAITLIADSLALMREFQRLDPSLSQAQIELIIGASSASSAKPAALLSDGNAAESDSLEKALFALRRAFDSEATEVPADGKPGGFGDIANRQSYYEDLARLPQQGTYRIEVLAGKSAAEIALLAKRTDDTGLAVRYALSQLEPFAVVGGNYASPRFPNGEIDLYDAATEHGLSEKWIEARSQFLEVLSRYRLADGDLTVAQIGGYFQDQERGITLGSPQPGRARVIFGSDANEQALIGLDGDDLIFGGASGEPITVNAGNDYVEGGGGRDVVDGGPGSDELHGGGGNDQLQGGAEGDRLYGEAGDDELNGEAGPDLLFGGEGDDTLSGGADPNTLEGGPGFDRYVVQSGVGTHLVRDVDGRGTIEIDGQGIDGGRRTGGNHFSSADGRVSYEFVGDLNLGGTLSVNGQVTVEGFKNGDLGILLSNSPDAGLPTPAYTFIRSRTPVGGTVQLGATDANDLVISGPIDAAYPDVILPGAPTFLYLGDDVYQGGVNYRDVVSAGPGDDFVYASVVEEGADAVPGFIGDFVVGDAGRDVIVGGDGNDEIYGDFSRATGPYPNSVVPYDGQRLFDLGDLRMEAFQTGSSQFEYTASWGDPQLSQNFSFDARSPFPGNSSVEAALAYALGENPGDASQDDYDDSLEGGAGDDIIRGGPGGDEILGGAGNDRLFGDDEQSAASYQAQRLTFGGFADALGQPGDDWIDGGEGDDYISDILGGSDTFFGGPGDDTINNAESWTELVRPTAPAVNFLSGGDGADVIGSYNHVPFGFDTILGGAGNDRISAEATRVHIDGGEGDDRITVLGPGSADVLGGSGNDLISTAPEQPGPFPTFGQDRFGPGAPASTFDGGAGDDTYVVSSGVIRDEEGDDTLVVMIDSSASLEALFDSAARGLVQLPAGFTLREGVARSGNDLVLSRAQSFAGQGSAASLTIAGWFAGVAPPIEHVITPAGELSPQQLETWGSFAVGSDADEVFAGGGHRDRILAGGGNDAVSTGDGDDVLDGGSGSDAYYYALGDGDDRIADESGDDRLVFAQGIGVADVSVSSIGPSSVFLSVAGGAIELAGSTNPAVERLVFADGQEVTVSGLLQTTAAVAGAGGNDILRGNAVANLIAGGPGDDVLAGGAGDDMYFFNLGDGVDRIADLALPDEGNAIRFGPDISPDMLSLGSGSLQIRVGDGGDAVHLENVDPDDMLGAHDVDLFEFDDGTRLSYAELLTRGMDLDGTSSDDIITGSNIADRVRGLGGDDVLVDGAGDDTYFFSRGDGADTLVARGGATGGTDSLVFAPGISAEDVSVRASGDDIVLELANGGGSVTVQEARLQDVLERVEFADGSAWTAAMLRERAEPVSNQPPVQAPPAASTDGPSSTPQQQPSEPRVEQGQEAAAASSVADAVPAPAPANPPTPPRRAGGATDEPALPASAANTPPQTGIPLDPLFRDMQKRFDVLLQTGRTNLGERYAEAIREFEERRRQREEPPLPQPSEEEIEAWNSAMHAWHERNPGFAETDLGTGDGAWTLGWGLPASGSLGADGGAGAAGLPGLANPHALPRLSGTAPPPGLGEGLRDLR